MAGPLTGVTVLDLTRLLPGGFCTGLLGDLGADVVKVEDTGMGDYMRFGGASIGPYSGAHWVLNRNKRSMRLNLKLPEGVAVLERLASSADVLVEGFRPGVMDKLGVGYEDLRQANAALVYCSISGYGADGPYRDLAGHDVNYMSYTGGLSVCGQDPEAKPAFPGLQIGDVGGGGLMAAVGILAALVRARETGKGDFVDIGMSDGIVSWLAPIAGEYIATGKAPGPGEYVLNGRFPCYDVYECADGRYVSVGALEPQFWAALVSALGRSDLAHGFDPSHREEIAAEFAQRTRDEWMDVFEGLDVCVAPVKTVAEAFEDPQVRHRGMVVEQEHPSAGKFPQLGIPVKLREAPGALERVAPAHGEHTDEVLAAAGYGPEEIVALRRGGVV